MIHAARAVKLKINTATGLLSSAQYLSSPHFNQRPESIAVDMIVVHGISLPAGVFGAGHIEPFFCGHLDENAHPDFANLKDMKVSAHLLIDRQGRITQFVPFHLRAWHAGESAFAGRLGCNDFSIGIELEGTDDLPYEIAQYEQLAKVIHVLKSAYPNITRERIVGHSDIAPGRKTDPGLSFDWRYLDCLLTACSA
jgi:AmpD protein